MISAALEIFDSLILDVNKQEANTLKTLKEQLNHPKKTKEIIEKCAEMKTGFATSSTTHIRLRMVQDMLTHLLMEEELKDLMKKTEISEIDLKRIDEISAAVDEFKF